MFGSERLTGALLDRLTHHVHILEMNGDSFRLATSKKSRRRAEQAPDPDQPSSTKGDATTEAPSAGSVVVEERKFFRGSGMETGA